MELRTLRYFVTTAEAGTVTAAAEALHVTQPGVSRQLRSLETDLGVDLFDRAKGRLDLTPAGRAILPMARDVLHLADGLRVAAHQHAHGRLERVTVAAPATTLVDVVSPFVAHLVPSDPVPSVLEADGWSIEEALRRGADLVVTLEEPTEGDHDFLTLPTLPVHACVPRTHAWAARSSIALSELVGHDVLGLPAHSTARRVVDTAVARAGLPPLTLIETSNTTIAQALAAGGRGVAVVSDEPRYGLIALPITDGEGASLAFTLRCLWESRHPAAGTLADLAGRLVAWTHQHYS